MIQKSDIVVTASVTPRALWAANLKQISKVVIGTKNAIFGNWHNIVRHKWARKDTKRSIRGLFSKTKRSIRGLFSKMEVETSVSNYFLVRAIKPEQVAQFLDDYVNCGMKDYREGEAIGKTLRTTHPTLQGSIIRLALGIIIGLSKDKEYTDARNEVPIAMGKKIAEMIENGELKMGYMI